MSHTEPTLNECLLSKYIICNINNGNDNDDYHNDQQSFNVYCVPRPILSALYNLAGQPSKSLFSKYYFFHQITDGESEA